MTPATLRRAIRDGNVPFRTIQIGKFLRVPTADVEAVVSGLDIERARDWLAEHEVADADDQVLDRAAAVILSKRTET